MICEQCGIEHDGSYGTGRFCSSHCRSVFSGKYSNKYGKLTGHVGYRGPKHFKTIVDNSGAFICKFCGGVRKNKNSLINHERLCRLNPNRDIRSYINLRSGCAQYNAGLSKGTKQIWNKGLSASTDIRIRKYAKTSRNRYAKGELVPTFKGKKHTDITKQKIRESTLRYIELTAGGARYSIKACEYFDKLNTERGWNLVHARNGGETHIGRYYVDAYDKENNIVVEYDENRHHLEGTNRRERDIKREQEIKKMLGCKFYRYSEFNDILYEV